jgi:hypothetical protein
MRFLYLLAAFSFSLSAETDLEPTRRNWAAPLQWQPSVGETSKSGERAATSAPLSLVAISPCRVLDTRPNAPVNQRLVIGPVAAGQAVTVPMLASACGIPAGAVAYSLNFTVDTTLNNTPVAFVSAWPAGDRPNQLISIINAPLGGYVANAAIVPAGINGAIEIFASNPTHVIIDINGYFATAAGADVPVAVYNQPAPAPGVCAQVVTTRRMNFSERVIDTDNAVTTGTNWTFRAPRNGYYAVTATTSANGSITLNTPSAVLGALNNLGSGIGMRSFFGTEAQSMVSRVVFLRTTDAFHVTATNSDACPLSGYISIHFVRAQ